MDEDERVDAVADASDILLERVDMAIDQSKSLRNQPQMTTTRAEAVTAYSAPSGTAPARQVRLMHAQNVQRPQISFPDPVDNSETTVFVPKLKTKPNAILDLKASLLRSTFDASSESGGAAAAAAPGPAVTTTTVEATEASDSKFSPNMNSYIKTLGIRPKRGDLVQYPHPYGAELHAWEPTDDMVAGGAEQMYSAVKDTAFSSVTTVEELAVLKDTLDAADVIAIDLEAHNYRTYYSFTCLMQISTRTEDFIVDTLALRGELHVLNSSFTNPKTVKVLHGADSDILWLQKDLGLYIVGMFDTGQAMQVLELPRKSLAYLLQHYCSITVDKTYQLADWRARPLSAEMLNYAREDTHYLLYVYDRLKNDLVAKGNAQANLLRAVWDRSRDVALQRYEKTVYDASMAEALYNKNSRTLSSRQLNVFKAVHVWRDELARQEDESVRYVLPDHQLFELADVQPREIPQVLACCKPVPPMVRINAHIIIQVISSAMINESDGPNPLRGSAALAATRLARAQAEDDGAAGLKAAAALVGKKLPIGEVLLAPPTIAGCLTAKLSAVSCVAQAFEAGEVGGSGGGGPATVDPALATKVEQATATFLRESLVAQLQSVQPLAGSGTDIAAATAAATAEAAEAAAAAAAIAATRVVVPASVQADADAAAAAYEASMADPTASTTPANTLEAGDGIMRLSTMKRANSGKSKRKREGKQNDDSLQGTSKSAKSTSAKTLDGSEGSLSSLKASVSGGTSKSALKKQKKKAAAAAAAAATAGVGIDGSYNPYGHLPKKK
jgi:exosome complex exonuclease RRP6